MTAEIVPIRILIAEDEEHLGAILEHFLRGRGYAVSICRDGRRALDALQRGAYDVALLDVVMPEMDGLEVLRRIQDDASRPEVIIITGNGTIDTAITAIRLGAYDYISKPYRMAEIDVMVRRAWEKRELGRANAMLRTRLGGGRWPTSNSPRMQALLARLEALAPSPEPVVLSGEAGVGKRYLACAMHARSGRAADAIVELAGRGGRTTTRADLSGSDTLPGAFAVAERGTIVVDLESLDADARAELMRAMETRSYAGRDGAETPLTARLIVCTREDAVEAVGAAGVGAARVVVPPLRERPEDLVALATELLTALEGGTRSLGPDVGSVLATYSWPGNVTELQSVLTRATLLVNTPQIAGADLRLLLAAGALSVAGTGGALSDLERMHIEAMLVRYNWHQGRAAVALGISTKTLYRKMREYGFNRPRGRRLGASKPPRGLEA